MGVGHGKIIIMGDHFVVYGIPAIVSSIDRKIIAKIEQWNGKGILCDYKGFWKGKNLMQDDKETEWLRNVMNILLNELNLQGKKFYLKLQSSIPVGVGLGSSAAISVAIAKELNEFFELGLNEERICEVAYKAEEFFHGTPSGIDNTIATYGGLLKFEKNLAGGKNRIERMKIEKPIRIVIGNTEKKGNTKELVEAVRERKEANPKEYKEIFAKAKKLVGEAEKALKEGDLRKIGELMNENNALLCKIGVSTAELEELCKIALENKALGAKITGAGGGGCMFALTPEEKVQERVAEAFEKNDYEGIKTKIGV